MGVGWIRSGPTKIDERDGSHRIIVQVVCLIGVNLLEANMNSSRIVNFNIYVASPSRVSNNSVCTLSMGTPEMYSKVKISFVIRPSKALGTRNVCEICISLRNKSRYQRVKLFNVVVSLPICFSSECFTSFVLDEVPGRRYHRVGQPHVPPIVSKFFLTFVLGIFILIFIRLFLLRLLPLFSSLSSSLSSKTSSKSSTSSKWSRKRGHASKVNLLFSSTLFVPLKLWAPETLLLPSSTRRGPLRF